MTGDTESLATYLTRRYADERTETLLIEILREMARVLDVLESRSHQATKGRSCNVHVQQETLEPPIMG